MKQFKSMRMVSLCMAAVMTLSCSQAVISYAAESSQSENIILTADADGVISIGTYAEFAAFAHMAALDTNTEGRTFRLTADISLKEPVEVPIFCGIFDGGGYTISGLSLRGDGSAKGLFRYIREDGLVKELNVAGSVSPTGSAEKLGGIAGVNKGRIVNCTFVGNVRGQSDCGGIAGINEETGLIAGCTSSGTVQAKHYTGGICGRNYGSLIHCRNNSSVNTLVFDETVDISDLSTEELYESPSAYAADITDVGGITGYSNGSVQDCENYGNVGYTHVGYNVGGIAGRHEGYISGCDNYGTINGRKDTAGIVGQAEPHISLLFSEQTADNLRDQLDELNGLIDQSSVHAEEQSASMSDNVNDVLNGFDSVVSAADQFSQTAESIINKDVSAINEFSSRVTDLVDMASPAADSFTSASDCLAQSAETLSDASERMKNAVSKADEGFDVLFPALDELSGIISDISSASKNVREGMDSLQSSMGDPESMSESLEELSKSLSELGNEVSELSKWAGKTLDSVDDYFNGPEYKEFKDDLEKSLREIADASSEMSGTIDEINKELQELSDMIEFEDFTTEDCIRHLAQIAKLLSEGSTGRLFDGLNDVIRLVSDQTKTIAWENFRQEMGDAADGVSDALGNLSGTANDITATAGSISDITDPKSFFDFVDSLSKAADSTEGTSDKAQKIIALMQDSYGSFDEAAAEAAAAAAEASDAASLASDASDNIGSGFEQIGNILDYFSGKEKIEFTGAEDDLISAREQLSSSMEKVNELCSTLTVGTDGSVNILAEDIRSINKLCSDISDTFFELAEEYKDTSMDIEDYTEDISGQDTYGRSSGKVSFCHNYGSINGDVDVGGIAGAMAVEYDFDPEGDIEVVGDRSHSFMYQSKTVVRNCVNSGTVTAKRSGAGGIAGNMETGCLISCVGLGDVSVEDGGYAGGTAGRSSSAVYGCSAMCTVSAAEYAGGIVGSGNDIFGCRSFAEVKDAAEFFGAVAGKCDGEMDDNAFVDMGMGGADNISYGGKAYPVSYSDMLELEGTPRAFSDLSVTFVADEKIVAEVDFDYGLPLDERTIPAIPAKNGCFAEWDGIDSEPLTFRRTVNAVYSPFITAVASSEKRENGRSVMMVQGRFTADDAVLLTKTDTGWSAVLPDDGEESHIIRYIPSEAPDKVRLMLTVNGAETAVDTVVDGSCLVFTVTGSTFTVSEQPVQTDKIIYAAAGGAASVAVIAIALAAAKKKKKKK